MTDPAFRKACLLTYHIGGVLGAMLFIALGFSLPSDPRCSLQLLPDVCAMPVAPIP